MKQSTLKRSAGLALSAALVLTTMIPNFATTNATTDSTAASTTQTTIEKRAMGKHDRGNLFEKEIASGTLSQTQADAIKAAMEANKTSDTHKKPEVIMAELVAAGTITQAQLDAIEKNRPTAPMGDHMKGERKTPFANAVTAGTITQTQADAIKAALDANRTSDTHKTMETIMAELVTAGTLTQAQVDALVKEMPTKPEKPVKTRPSGVAQ